MKNLKEIFGKRTFLNVGFTRATFKKNELTIGHGGNMGDSVEHSVNPNLKIMGLPTVDELKDNFIIEYEIGDPDYSWAIKFKI